MFYLLENYNRIIETNSAEWYCGRLKVILNEEERYKYSNHISWNLKDGYYKYFTVKKQSNNVFDLIDWEQDLVRITWSDKRNFIIDCNINKSDFFDGYYSFEWITAIYKPDNKGNYIKVWEREEEDETCNGTD